MVCEVFQTIPHLAETQQYCEIGVVNLVTRKITQVDNRKKQLRRQGRLAKTQDVLARAWCQRLSEDGNGPIMLLNWHRAMQGEDPPTCLLCTAVLVFPERQGSTSVVCFSKIAHPHEEEPSDCEAGHV
jgi:hypothetical protein